ncbi:murein biosynthesis integral membrane protein MurJ [Actinomyces sp. F1_1611]
MAEPVPPEQASEEPLAPRQQSLLRSSVLMASGTMVSRVLGFLRNAMLIAAIGVSLGASDAFGAANMLPNSVYNLLAAGVFDAILIPQIVRALKRKDGNVYVNRLITAAGTILFGITVLTMIGAPLLLSITSSGFPPDVRNLAIAFAVWCLPQIFFYGLYNLLGEVLNARGIFGPYMWAPVVNNVVAITGLGIFLYLWGPSGDVFPASEFTSQQMVVLAGSATLGVVFQALVLIIPLRHSGVKLRPDFRFRQTNFGSASKVAGWTFATLMVSQLGVLSTTNLASHAVRAAEEADIVVAGLSAYNTAFMIYMVPQSLIALTLSTAIFTRLANNAADGDYQAVARNYTMGVRLIVMLSMLSVAVMLVAAVPLMQLVMPKFDANAASMYASVVVALIMGVPSTGIVMISQRVFFAFENAKPVFLMGIVPTVLQLIVGWSFYFLTGPEWWMVGASIGETVCRILQGFIAIFWTAHLVRTINAGRLIAYYVRYLVAFAISAVGGWGLLHLIGPASLSSSSTGRFADAFWKVLLVGVVVTGIYLLVLTAIDKSGTRMLGSYLGDRLPKKFQPAFLRSKPEATPNSKSAPSPEAAEAKAPGDEAEEPLTSQLPLLGRMPLGAAGAAGAAGLAGVAGPGGDDNEGSPLVAPSWDEIVDGDFASRSVTRSLGGFQELSTGQIPMIMSQSQRPQSNDTPEGISLNDEETKSPGSDGTEPDSGAPESLPPGEAITTPVGEGESVSDQWRESLDALLMGDDELEHPTAPAASDAPKVRFGQVGATPVAQASPAGGVPAEPSRGSMIPKLPGVEGSGVKRPSGHGPRFNPTGPAMAIAALLVIGGAVFAVNQLRQPIELPTSGDQQMSGEQSGQQSGEVPAADGAAPADPATAPPVINSIWVSSWQDDGGDHPELVGALTDGDPETLWYTRYYDLNQFGEDSMISLLVNLQSEAVVSEITLDVQGSGGEVAIRLPEGDDPRVGQVLATSAIDGTTTIKLAQPTKMSRIGINFISLPTDNEGLNRAQISGLSIK